MTKILVIIYIIYKIENSVKQLAYLHALFSHILYIHYIYNAKNCQANERENGDIYVKKQKSLTIKVRDDF